jgi:hypothetical protein
VVARAGAPLRGCGFSTDCRTMYVVDCGEVFTDFQMSPQFYTVPKSGVIWTITYEGPATR